LTATWAGAAGINSGSVGIYSESSNASQALDNFEGGDNADTTPPTVTAFTISSPSSRITTTVLSFTATDDTGVHQHNHS
jgi:hypothetical protein